MRAISTYLSTIIAVYFMLFAFTSVAQNSNGLPRAQMGFSLKYNVPQSFVREFIDENSFGYSFNINYRISDTSPLLIGFEYDIIKYYKEYINNSDLSSVDLNVNVAPTINDFIFYGKYELLPTSYIIPYVQGGLGMRYYRLSFTDYDPRSGDQLSTYSENSDFSFVGEVGFGIGVPIISPLLIELEATYSRSSAIQYDYLEDGISGVEAYPIDFYNFTTSSQEFLTFGIRLVIEFQEE